MRMVYLRNVTTLKVDREKCTPCGACLVVCPHAVLSRVNGKIGITDRDACMECGACARNCPHGAISVKTGVGCAAAVVASALGIKKASCCSVESTEDGGSASGSGCC